MPVHCHPRFPSRNRRFPDRCRSPDCASTAFRCRCLLLRQKLFVLPCRRLRNNYILCPTGTPTFAAARRQRRDLIIATRPAHQPLPSLLSAAAGAGAISRPGASAFFVSDGPISSNSGRNGGKNAGRNCVSALPQRATADSDFPHLLAGITFHHRCQSKGLCLRSPARRLPRPLAPATAGVFRSYRRTPISLPFEESVLLSSAPPKAFPLGGRCQRS